MKVWERGWRSLALGSIFGMGPGIWQGYSGGRPGVMPFLRIDHECASLSYHHGRGKYTYLLERSQAQTVETSATAAT